MMLLNQKRIIAGFLDEYQIRQTNGRKTPDKLIEEFIKRTYESRKK